MLDLIEVPDISWLFRLTNDTKPNRDFDSSDRVISSYVIILIILQ